LERLISPVSLAPPQSIEAEQSTLGSMLLERWALEKGLEMLTSDDFYRPSHQEVFDVLAALRERDEPADIITVQDELKRRNRLDDIGGTEYLMTLAESVPTAANVEYYAKIIERKSILRKLIAVGTEIIGMAGSEDDDIDGLTDRAEQAVFKVGQRRLGRYFSPIVELLEKAWEWAEQRYHDKGETSGVATGFTKIDHMTSGFQPSDLVIIAARPSMGKTAFALDVAVNAATKAGKTVAVFSLEMSAFQLVQRIVCAKARVDAHRLRTGYLQSDEWDRLGQATSDLYQAKIFIDDSTETTPLAMRAKCRRLAAEHGLDMVVIDYLQLIHSGNRRSENRQQEISEIARNLKGLARELKVPVIALSQLSRGPEKRDDKRPMLSDLRDSGSIEAEADLVAMLFRADYYDHKEVENTAAVHSGGGAQEDGTTQIETTEIIIAKHRNGPTGTVKIGFVRKFASFENLAEGYEEN